MPRRRTAAPQIYQLKITLKGIRPPIWRRVQVPGDTRLDRLHENVGRVVAARRLIPGSAGGSPASSGLSGGPAAGPAALPGSRLGTT